MNGLSAIIYIDPGTGAMLFSVLMGVVSALFFVLRKAILKLKFILSGGKVKDDAKEKHPYVIFSDSKRYWNVFKPICDEFERREIPCEFWTASPDDPALSEDYKYVKCLFIGEGNKAFAKLNCMNADICLSTTPGLDVYQWKRSKDTACYVHTLHEVGEPVMYRMFGLDYYDAVLLNGEFQEPYIRKIEGLRGLEPKELVVVGATYMDTMYERYQKLEKKDKPEKVILAAPTWGVSSILNRFGDAFIQALIDTGYKIIIRPHPQMATSDPELLDRLKKKFPENEKFSWNADNDNFDVLNEADVMISDFSGVVFDYTLIFDKPIVYADTNLDLAPYDAAWLDETIWRKQVLPELGKELQEKDFANMKEFLDDLMENEKYSSGREHVRDVSWQCRNEAAVRTVDYLVKKHEEIVAGKEEAHV